MTPRLYEALVFAMEAHKGQTRKYTGEPYICHPIEVSYIVSQLSGSEEAQIAALLHDVLEDTDTPLATIIEKFGMLVADLVYSLTDVSTKSDGNRAKRKAIDRNHIANANFEAKNIKLADLISNTRSIVEHDKDFAKVYLKEKELLLPLLRGANPELLKLAENSLIQAHLKLLEYKHEHSC